MIINIRGTNGSGKTTLARELIGSSAQPVDLVEYEVPSKIGRPPTVKRVEGWGTPGGNLAVGSYKRGCGGMDTIPSFELQQEAIRNAVAWDRDGKALAGPAPQNVIAEGVLASTVFGSWGDFLLARKALGDKLLVAYLDTPIELCLERITARQAETKRGVRDIKVEQVQGKVKAIEATRPKFIAAGIPTVVLRWDRALEDLLDYLELVGEAA